MSRQRPFSTVLKLLPEAALLSVIGAAVLHIVHVVTVEGYLPQPFIWDTRDTFMDWYNTAYWANNKGAYSVWGSVYPPLSFVFMRIFSTQRCYHTESIAARDCDGLGMAAILGFYALGMALAFLAFRKRDRKTALIRALTLSLSCPVLFAVERGNLLVPCFVAFVLAHGDLLRSRWARALAAALTINFKPYLLAPVMALAVQRRWRALELAGVATVAVYLASYALFGAGTPFEIISNTRNWINFTATSFIGQVYMTTSFNGFFGVLDHGFPILNFTDSQSLDNWILRVRALMLAAQIVGVAAVAGAWLQPKALPLARVANLLLLIALVQQSPGGYAEMFVLFLVFLEPWERPAQIVAIILAYLIAVPYDVVFAQLPNIWSDSWLTGRAVLGHFGISIGQFLRPGALLFLLLALAIDSLIQIARAHRFQRPHLALGAPAALAGMQVAS